MMEDASPKVYYFHVAKCGGTSAANYICKNYSKDKILQGNDINDAINTLPGLTYGDLTETISGADCVVGHIQVDQVIDNQFIWLTMIRDPFDRLMSLYRYYQATSDAECEAEGLNGKVKRLIRGKPIHHLPEIVDCIRESWPADESAGALSFIQNEFINHITRRYSCLERIRDPRGLERELVSQPDVYSSMGLSLLEAKRTIQKFDRVGILENFDEFISDLAVLFNSPIEHERFNATPIQSPNVYAHSESEIERARSDLKDWYEMDQELYEFALEIEAEDVSIRKWQDTLQRVRRDRKFGYLVPEQGESKRYTIRDPLYLTNVTGRSDINRVPSAKYFVAPLHEGGIIFHFFCHEHRFFADNSISVEVAFDFYGPRCDVSEYQLVADGFEIKSKLTRSIILDGQECHSLVLVISVEALDFSLTLGRLVEQAVLLGIKLSSAIEADL